MTREEVKARVRAHETFLRADLRGADLRGLDLTGVYFADADLSGADLTDCNLDRAVLVSANLTNADLSYCRLTGANLREATLTGSHPHCAFTFHADFIGAKGVICAGISPAGERFIGVWHRFGALVYPGTHRSCTINLARRLFYRSPDALARIELIAAWEDLMKERNPR